MNIMCVLGLFGSGHQKNREIPGFSVGCRSFHRVAMGVGHAGEARCADLAGKGFRVKAHVAGKAFPVERAVLGIQVGDSKGTAGFSSLLSLWRMASTLSTW